MGDQTIQEKISLARKQAEEMKEQIRQIREAKNDTTLKKICCRQEY